MASINFLYRSKKKQAPLVVRLLFRSNGKDFVFGARTKVLVEKDYWEKQHFKKSKSIEVTNKQTGINIELNKIEKSILSAFSETIPEHISKEWLSKQIELYYEPQQPKKEIPNSLIDYIDFYIQYRKYELNKSSILKFNVVKNKLKRLESQRNSKKPILIKEVDNEFKREFIEFSTKNMYSKNTQQKEFDFIKSFCKHARFLGLETHPHLDNLKIEKEKVEKIYLTFEELELIEKIDELSESLDNVRDWLIISCYSGQRISDFLRFKPEMIRYENEKPLLEFTQRKTKKEMTIPLHPKIIEILKKRGGKFPYRISDQKYNDYIKIVCQKANIIGHVQGSKSTLTEYGIRKQKGVYKKYELVTSHIGRRSFATNFYGIIPTSFLIYITGHSTESMFLSYIGKSNKDLAKEISNYF